MIIIVLIILTEGHWEEEQNRKKFFDTIASENSFDPLVPNNWYSVSKSGVLKYKV